MVLSALGHFVEGMPFEEVEIGARKTAGKPGPSFDD
jgi:hypothetical protein